MIMTLNSKANAKQVILKILLYITVSFICIFILYPYFTMFVTALKSREEIFDPNGTIFPIKAMWSNFSEIWKLAPMGNYMLNSILIASGSTAIAFFIIVSSICFWAGVQPSPCASHWERRRSEG